MTQASTSTTRGCVREVQRRLDALCDGIDALRAEGLPVARRAAGRDLPQRALRHHRLAHARRRTVETNERSAGYLLRAAGFAAVQFQAFGFRARSGWFRLSVGAVSPAPDRGPRAASSERAHRAHEVIPWPRCQQRQRDLHGRRRTSSRTLALRIDCAGQFLMKTEPLRKR